MNQSNVVSGIALTASLLALVAVGVLRSSDRSEPPAVGSSLRVIGDCRISEEAAAAIIESALMRMGGQDPEEGASKQKAAEEIMQELLERRVWTRREFDSYIFALSWKEAASVLEGGGLEIPEVVANVKRQFARYAVSIGRDVGCRVIVE